MIQKIGEGISLSKSVSCECTPHKEETGIFLMRDINNIKEY
jgi:hypothetical protein